MGVVRYVKERRLWNYMGTLCSGYRIFESVKPVKDLLGGAYVNDIRHGTSVIVSDESLCKTSSKKENRGIKLHRLLTLSLAVL